MKNDLIYYIAIALVRIFNLLPRTLVLWLARVGGVAWYLLGKNDRRRAVSQMAFALGLPPDEARRQARRCFQLMAQNLVDAARMRRWSKEQIGQLVKVEGLQHVEAAMAEGKGMLALTGHIGNFELLAAWFAYYKNLPVSVIGRQLYDPRFDRLLVDQRRHFGIENIPSTAPAMAVVDALRRKRALGVLLDQDSSKVSGYFVDFFGRKANTAAAPVFIAGKLGVPIVPMAIYRCPGQMYLIRILPKLNLEWTGNRDTDMIKALTQCNQALEQLIRYDPAQWAWNYNRWRQRPREESAK